MFDYVEIDRTAHEGFEAFSTGRRIPGWVLNDQMLMDAWNLAHRQAAGRSKSSDRAGKAMNVSFDESSPALMQQPLAEAQNGIQATKKLTDLTTLLPVAVRAIYISSTAVGVTVNP